MAIPVSWDGLFCTKSGYTTRLPRFARNDKSDFEKALQVEAEPFGCLPGLSWFAHGEPVDPCARPSTGSRQRRTFRRTGGCDHINEKAPGGRRNLPPPGAVIGAPAQWARGDAVMGSYAPEVNE